MKRLNIFFQLFICLTNIYSNDRINFEKIDSRIGLSSDYVKEAIQDKDGFMWFCTKDGLNRYDGYSIKSYKLRADGTNYFSSDNFTCITEDKKGNLWLGTYQNGINIFNKETETVKTISTDESSSVIISNDQIQDLHCDSKGRIWIASYHGICSYDHELNKIKLYELLRNDIEEAPFLNLNCIYESPKGEIYLGSWYNGLYKYIEKTDSFINYKIEQDLFTAHESSPISSLVEDQSGYLWVGLWEGGLLKTRIDGDKIEYIDHYYHKPSSQNNRLNDNLIFSLLEQHDGSIWVGTEAGLNIIPNPERKNSKIYNYNEGIMPYELSVSSVLSMTKDESGSIWLCTEGGGINKVDLKRYNFELYQIPKNNLTKSSRKIHTIFPIDKNKVFIGTGTIGVGLFDLEKRIITPYHLLPYFKGLYEIENIHTAVCLYKDSKGNFWIGTLYSGLFRRDGKTGKWERVIPQNAFHESSPISYQCMTEDKYGRLWVGTSRGLIKLTYNSTDKKYNIRRILPDSDNPSSIVGKNISRLLFDSKGTFWVATEDGGISALTSDITKNNSFSFTTNNYTESDNRKINLNQINTIVEDRDGRIWIGTGTNGIVQYHRNEKRYEIYSNIAELIGETVYDIIPDEEGTLWLTTNKGLVSFTIKMNKINVQNFTYEDGLQGNIFMRGAANIDSLGYLYIGGAHGFNRFYPKDFKRNEYIPPVVISDITINNKPAERNRIKNNELILTHLENSFSVLFSALSYSQAKKNKFSHKLEGFDKEWIMTDYKDREAVYTSLPPGKYKLKIKAANNSWVWNPNPTVLNIRVKPAPYLSLFAKICYGVILVVIIYSFYRFKLNNLRIKQALEIVKIEKKKEDNVNNFKLRFFTNISHEILTPLSIISFSVNESLEKSRFDKQGMISVSRNVNRLMTLVRQLLDFRKIETGKMRLNVAQNNVDELFQQLNEYYFPLIKNRNLTFHIKGKINKAIYIDIEKLETIVSNLLSNAFKYSEDNGKVEMTYLLKGDAPNTNLIVTVSDSGEGIDKNEIENVFDRFYRANSVTGKTFGAGIGLALVKNLTELHKGKINVRNKAKGNGAIFTLKIPVSKEIYSPNEFGDSAVKLSDEYNAFEFEEGEMVLNNSIQPNGKNDRYKILVVEDNKELRVMISNHLSNYYKVYEAIDGLEALKLIKKVHPNMIISDVMMPNMDGFDLCKKIKLNIEFSHIIVILLTAKVTNDDRLTGYSSGANSYLTKPLDFKLLITRVESLRKQYQDIKNRYSEGLLSEAKPEGLSPIDQKFIKELIEIIKQDITNPELNIKYLLDKIPMSHSSLYRKTRDLTGLSPNEFIRYVRLNEAANLLVNKDMRVTDVAYMVGFTEHSYFSRCFKKQFNLTPKQYNKEKSIRNSNVNIG